MAKAIIGITDWGKSRGSLLDVARRFDAGERLPESDYLLNFPDPIAMLEAMPPKRLETMRTIKSIGPRSIYALATHVGRNYSNVHADVQRLIELGLAEKDETGRVLIPWEDVVVRIDSSLVAAA